MGRTVGRRGGWLCHTRPLWVWVCGGGMWLVALVVRLTVGAPYTVCHMAEAVVPLPPLWLLGLLWQGMAFAAGCAWGSVLGLYRRGAYREMWIFRGSTYMALAAAGCVMWYTFLFGAVAPLVSFFCLLAAVCLSVMTALSWWRICRGAVYILVGWVLWLFFLLCIHFSVMFHI